MTDIESSETSSETFPEPSTSDSKPLTSFTVKASALNEALASVGMVKPKPLNHQGASVYLFAITGDTCRVYSRDTVKAARSVLPLESLPSQDVSFLYPAQNVKGFGYLANEDLTFDIWDNPPRVSYRTSGGAAVTRSSYDPKLVAPIDKDLESAKPTGDFSAVLLREALILAKPFTAEVKDTRVQEAFRSVQIFDGSKPEWAKGNGVLFASTGESAFYFRSASLADKGMSIHAQHLSEVQAFLGRCTGTVQVSTGKQMTYASDTHGHVLGWTHHVATHAKFTYPGLEKDQYRWMVATQSVLHALRYLESEMDTTQTRKVRLVFTESTHQIRFETVDAKSKVATFPVPVEPLEGSTAEDITLAFNVQHLIASFTGLRGNEVQLRLNCKSEQNRFLRTVDEYVLDESGRVVGGSNGTVPQGAHACQVTRLIMHMT